MSIAPTDIERMSRARADLRMGLPVILEDHTSATIFAAVETLSEDRLGDLRDLGAPVSLVVTQRRAETLKAHAYDGDLARIALPSSSDLTWVRAIADPSSDLQSPMKGPFEMRRGGDVSPLRAALQLVKSARLLPALVAVDLPSNGMKTASDGLTRLSVASVTDAFSNRSPLERVVSARLPLEVSETGRLHVFRPADGGEEHYAIEIGKPDRKAPLLARLHSACFTGDLMGSLKCDCGPQLRAALAHMGQEGNGVLLYMNQEGRGIGLTNKMRAYALQDQGFDTVEANHRLGFEDDERDFRLGSDILRNLGFSQVRLLTNNPRKVGMMEASGIKVTERVPLKVGENRHNAAYLATKIAKSGHLE